MNLAMLRERIHAADKHPKEVNRTLLDAYAASKACLSADERRWCERVLFGRAGVEQPMGGVMFTRRSVRRYTGEEVCDRDIDSLLEAARWAPSSCNRQPIEIVSVSDPERIQLIAEVRRQPFVAKANRVLAVVVDMESYQTDANYFALLDAGAAIQNMLLAAEAAGLGACWVNMCCARLDAGSMRCINCWPSQSPTGS